MDFIKQAIHVSLKGDRQVELFAHEGKLVLVQFSGKGWCPKDALRLVERTRLSAVGRRVLLRTALEHFNTKLLEALE